MAGGLTLASNDYSKIDHSILEGAHSGMDARESSWASRDHLNCNNLERSSRHMDALDQAEESYYDGVLVHHEDAGGGGAAADDGDGPQRDGAAAHGDGCGPEGALGDDADARDDDDVGHDDGPWIADEDHGGQRVLIEDDVS